MNLQAVFDCEMKCETNGCETNGCEMKCRADISLDECSICLDDIESSKNKLTTECGHTFHTSCLLKNASINGFGCPMCRAVLADEPDDDDDDEYEEEEEEEELYEEYALRGMRWLFQQAQGEVIVEADEDYDEFDDDDDEMDD
jgi:hypothetical protein